MRKKKARWQHLKMFVWEVPSKDEMQCKKGVKVVTCYSLTSSKTDKDNQLLKL